MHTITDACFRENQQQQQQSTTKPIDDAALVKDTYNYVQTQYNYLYRSAGANHIWTFTQRVALDRSQYPYTKKYATHPRIAPSLTLLMVVHW
jgi:hypothetical protein